MCVPAGGGGREDGRCNLQCSALTATVVLPRSSSRTRAINSEGGRLGCFSWIFLRVSLSIRPVRSFAALVEETVRVGELAAPTFVTPVLIRVLRRVGAALSSDAA